MIIVESKYGNELSGAPVFKHNDDMVVVGLVFVRDGLFYRTIPIDSIK